MVKKITMFYLKSSLDFVNLHISIKIVSFNNISEMSKQNKIN